jgi:hypothetical protein
MGLPTFKEKMRLYYPFLPFVTTCQNIYLLYNTESGLDAGEKSRFITQLE